MFDRNLLNLPGGRRMLALLLVFGVADATLVLDQSNPLFADLLKFITAE